MPANFSPQACSPTEEAGKTYKPVFSGDLRSATDLFFYLRLATIVYSGGGGGIESLGHPLICLFDTLFSCQCPLKEKYVLSKVSWRFRGVIQHCHWPWRHSHWPRGNQSRHNKRPDTKEMCQISIWGDSLGLKYELLTCLNLLDYHFNSYDFWNINVYYIIRRFILCPPLFSMKPGRRSRVKTGFCGFTCLSCDGACRRRVCCPCGTRRKKNGGPTVPVACRIPNFPPASADGEAHFTSRKQRVDEILGLPFGGYSSGLLLRLHKMLINLNFVVYYSCGYDEFIFFTVNNFWVLLWIRNRKMPHHYCWIQNWSYIRIQYTSINRGFWTN
jgi:hypothetical protein